MPAERDHARPVDAHLHWDVLSAADRRHARSRLHGALIPGITPPATRTALEHASDLPESWAWAAAWHPLHLPDSLEDEEVWSELASLLARREVRAVGETGLDYRPFVSAAERARQREAFRQHTRLAVVYQLPLIVHCVRAHADATAIVRETGAVGMVHAFSGSAEEANAWWELGWMLSFGPGLDKTSPRRAQRACQRCPADRLLVETDGPYGVLPDQNGSYDCSEALTKVVSTVARLRETSQTEILAQTEHNLSRLLGRS